jgi:hypothetical protein
MPRCRDLAIFVQTTDDRQTDCFTPAAHVRTRGNYITRLHVYNVYAHVLANCNVAKFEIH